LCAEHGQVIAPVFPLASGRIVDATGAGDAFFGGMIARVYNHGLPECQADVENIGKWASASGAACVQTLGGLPDLNSSAVIIKNLIGEENEGAPLFNKTHNSAPPGKTNVKHPFLQSLSLDQQNASSLLNSYEQDKGALSGALNAAAMLCSCISSGGHIYVTGVGKSGHIGRRFAASLSSVGIPAEYVPAPEWAHGDLGKLRQNDVVVGVSHSGETQEVVHALSLVAGRVANRVSVVSARLVLFFRFSNIPSRPSYLTYSNVIRVFLSVSHICFTYMHSPLRQTLLDGQTLRSSRAGSCFHR